MLPAAQPRPIQARAAKASNASVPGSAAAIPGTATPATRIAADGRQIRGWPTRGRDPGRSQRRHSWRRLRPGCAGPRVGKPDGAILVVHYAVEVEIAGTGGHDRQCLSCRVIEPPQSQSVHHGVRALKLAGVPAPVVVAGLEQGLDRGSRTASTCIVEDEPGRRLRGRPRPGLALGSRLPAH